MSGISLACLFAFPLFLLGLYCGHLNYWLVISFALFVIINASISRNLLATLPALIGLALLGIGKLTSHNGLYLWQPCLISVFLSIAFAGSLFCQQSLCEVVATRLEGNLNSFKRKYCWVLSLLWALVLVGNAAISGYLAYNHLIYLWGWYVCFFSYLLLGAFAMVELVVRRVLRSYHKRGLVSFIALSLISPAAHANPPNSYSQLMKQMLTRQTVERRFEQIRTVAGLPNPFHSTGWFRITPSGQMEWTFCEPIYTSLRISEETLVEVREGIEQPVTNEVKRRVLLLVRELLSGRKESIKKMFELSYTHNDTRFWLRLLPKHIISQRVKEIILTGVNEPDSVRVIFSSDNTIEILLREGAAGCVKEPSNR